MSHDKKEETEKKDDITNIFIDLCKTCDLNTVTQYYDENSKNIDPCYKNDLPFRTACINGNLDIAMWIYHKFNPNVSEFNHDAFFLSCFNNKLDVVCWLSSVDARYEYETIIDDEGKQKINYMSCKVIDDIHIIDFTGIHEYT
jgi:hypothetical protein